MELWKCSRCTTTLAAVQFVAVGTNLITCGGSLDAGYYRKSFFFSFRQVCTLFSCEILLLEVESGGTTMTPKWSFQANKTPCKLVVAA
jgi:hypothetical protein